jgi:hypothetical protein
VSAARGGPQDRSSPELANRAARGLRVIVLRTKDLPSVEGAEVAAQKLRRNAVGVGTCGTSDVGPKTAPS